MKGRRTPVVMKPMETSCWVRVVVGCLGARAEKCRMADCAKVVMTVMPATRLGGKLGSEMGRFS